MTDQSSAGQRWKLWAALAVVVLVIAGLSLPAGRNASGEFFRSLRMQKVQAVNVDLSSFTDPNANPTLHQMVAQMISDKVVVTANENGSARRRRRARPAQLAGFPCNCSPRARTRRSSWWPGAHAVNLTVDRARLQAIVTEAGHPDLVLPRIARRRGRLRADSARRRRAVRDLPRAGHRHRRYRQQHHRADAASTQYSDCVRLREGPSPDGERSVRPRCRAPGGNRT